MNPFFVDINYRVFSESAEVKNWSLKRIRSVNALWGAWSHIFLTPANFQPGSAAARLCPKARTSVGNNASQYNLLILIVPSSPSRTGVRLIAGMARTSPYSFRASSAAPRADVTVRHQNLPSDHVPGVRLRALPRLICPFRSSTTAPKFHIAFASGHRQHPPTPIWNAAVLLPLMPLKDPIMTLSNQLVEYVSACFTGLWIQSCGRDGTGDE